MNLLVTNTLSQLLNAAVISQTILKDEPCDVYYTSNLTSAAESFYEDGLFRTIYQIELVEDIAKRDTKISRALVRIKNAMDIGKIRKSLPSDPRKYKRVFVSGVSLRNMEIYYAMKKEHKSIELNLYEEGAFEYCELGMKKEWSKILFSFLFFHRYYLMDCKKMYVYKPELLDNNWDNIEICRIPCLMDQEQLIPSIAKAFDYHETKLKKNPGKFIILEQAFADENQESEQKDMIKMLSDMVGKDRIMIKLHPRSEQNKYGSEYDYLDTQTPFEIVAMSEDISSSTFVSITSSAVTNFKVLLDLEPNVIMLIRMFLKQDSINTENGKFIQRVQKSCKHENFYLPNNKEELRHIIKKIVGEQINV